MRLPANRFFHDTFPGKVLELQRERQVLLEIRQNFASKSRLLSIAHRCLSLPKLVDRAFERTLCLRIASRVLVKDVRPELACELRLRD